MPEPNPPQPSASPPPPQPVMPQAPVAPAAQSEIISPTVPPRPLAVAGGPAVPMPAPAGLPPAPAPQPGIIMGGAPIAELEQAKPKRHYWLIAVIVLVVAGLAAAAAVYFYVLPNRWANSYLSSVKPLYNKQLSQMTDAYNSLSLPVFTSDSESDATDKANIASLQKIVQSATAATSALKAGNKFKSLPSAGWLGSVMSAGSQKRNLDKYLSDSQKFLDDYSALVTYTDKFSQTTKSSQMDEIFENFVQPPHLTTIPQVAAYDQKIDGDLQDVVGQLNDMTPPPDLKQYQDSLTTNFQNMYNAGKQLLEAAQGDPSIDTKKEQAQYAVAGENIYVMASSAPTSKLQSDSTLNTQYQALKSDDPLQ